MACRRIWSIDRCFAVAISHAPGLSGTPCCGQRSSAASSASCARSSASPTSRTIRARPAISFADSIRQTASITRCASVAVTARNQSHRPSGIKRLAHVHTSNEPASNRHRLVRAFRMGAQPPCCAFDCCRRRFSCSISSGVSDAPKSSAAKTCRTSMFVSPPKCGFGARRAHSTASSSDFAWMIQNPAISSFVSVNGPSTTVFWFPLNTTRAPRELGCSPSPASMTPAFTNSSLYLPISANCSVVGITPASLSALAFTSIMNFGIVCLRLNRFGAGRPVQSAGADPSLYHDVERVRPKSTRELAGCASGVPRGLLPHQLLVPLHVGREGVAEVLRFDQLAHLEPYASVRVLGGPALHPLECFLAGAHLDDRVARDQLLRLGERPIDDPWLAARELDAESMLAWPETVAGEHDAGIHHLLIVRHHRIHQLAARQRAGLGLRVRLPDDHESHRRGSVKVGSDSAYSDTSNEGLEDRHAGKIGRRCRDVTRPPCVIAGRASPSACRRSDPEVHSGSIPPVPGTCYVGRTRYFSGSSAPSDL